MRFRLNARVPRIDEGNPRRPVSNVRVLHLTLDDFLGCERCFAGRHGEAVDGRCSCCCWPVKP